MKRTFISLTAITVCIAACIFASACSSAPIEPRSVMPADTLVYLETRDLGAALSAITENPKFRETAASVPNIEPLKGIKISVAVTGFETKETKTDGGSVLDLRPHFVAVAETNAWNFQARGFVEDKLDGLVKNSYGEKTKLNRVGKYDGDLYEWVATDGRRSYALVIGSAIYFSNDIAAIEKCLAVKRGEQEALKNREPADNESSLASGFISQDGIAQIANLLGVSAAMNTGDDADIQSFVARVLPQAVRGMVSEISWSAKRTDSGIEDEYRVKLKDETAAKAADAFRTFSEAASNDELYAFVPKDSAGSTRYELADPKQAWNSAVEITRENVDPVSANLIKIFSAALFEPYAVSEPEKFLENVDGSIITVKFPGENEDAVVIARIKNIDDVKAALSKDIRFSQPPEKVNGSDIWAGEDGDVAAAFSGNIVIAGSSDAVRKCLEAGQNGEDLTKLTRFEEFNRNGFSAATIANATDPDMVLFEALAGIKDGVSTPALYSVTRTSYNVDGITRLVISDFGSIGNLIERFAEE